MAMQRIVQALHMMSFRGTNCEQSKMLLAAVVVLWIEWLTWVCAIRVQFHLVRKKKLKKKEAGVGPY